MRVLHGLPERWVQACPALPFGLLQEAQALVQYVLCGVDVSVAELTADVALHHVLRRQVLNRYEVIVPDKLVDSLCSMSCRWLAMCPCNRATLTRAFSWRLLPLSFGRAGVGGGRVSSGSQQGICGSDISDHRIVMDCSLKTQEIPHAF